MTTSNFAQRHGFHAERPVFAEREHLPEYVRERAGEMMLEHNQRFAAWAHKGKASYKVGPWLFVQGVRASLPDTRDLWDWYEDANQSIIGYTRVTNWRTDRAELRRLLRPLKRCEWGWFYTVVENYYGALERKWASRANHFAAEINLLLASRGIPWILQGGLVVPADDYEFADELEYVGQAAPDADMSDPRVPLKKAFAALFRKQGGPDITSGCLHAWSAWETAREAAGGVNDVQSAYPELWDAITAWQELIHAGRHPGKKLGRLPTEGEARVIVGLLTNAVRLVSHPTATGETV